MPRVLIAGASVAGPALAYWLSSFGWQVDVVERAPRLRDEGQNIDVRRAARQVIDWMGLTAVVKGRSTGERGAQVVDERGHVVAEFGVDTGEQDGPTAELEVLRGALARLLVDVVPPAVSWTYDESIAGVTQTESDVQVVFSSGRHQSYDCVAVAEGQRSSTREIVFGSVPQRPLNVQIAFATIPKKPEDRDTWRWYNAPARRQIHLRPDDTGTIRAMLAFRSSDRSLTDLSATEQIRMLRERFSDAGWQAARILDDLDGDSLYFDDLTQVRAPCWSSGRVVLLGDSAHCVTPIGGGGTSLALIGAYILAQQLNTQSSMQEAFAAYERALRPHVQKAQRVSPAILRAAYPNTAAGIRLQRTAVKLAATPLVQRLSPSPASDLDTIELRPPDPVNR